ncbi:MAG: trigger factor [Myxococcota bacterium]
MKVSVEELSPIQKKVVVEVPPEDVGRALDRAYRTVNKSAKIPGFRPGKVPRRLLERHYGPQVSMQVTEDLVRDSWWKVVEQEKLRAVGMPDVDQVGEVDPGKPFEYTAKVEVLPEPKVTDFEGLPGERPKVKVEDEEIDSELERIQKSFAKLVPVEDRTKVQSGDYVEAEVKATVEGEPFDTGAEQGVTLEVSDGSIGEGHVPEAEGHEVGDTVQVEHQFPSEENVPENLRGKQGLFEIKITQIKRREVPPIDDELAKDLGEEGIDSLLALRGLIREKLTERKNSEAERHLTESLMKILVERNPIEVPPALVGRAAASMIRPYVEQMIRPGAQPGEFGSQEMIERLAETSRPHAEAMLKGSLLLQAVADKIDIQVGDEDLESYYEKTAKEMGSSPDKVKARMKKDPEELEGVKRRIREEKALAHLKEKASIKEVEPGEKEPSEEQPGGESAGEGAQAPEEQ